MGSSWVHQREMGVGEGEGEAAEVMRGVGVGGGVAVQQTGGQMWRQQQQRTVGEHG